MTSGPRKQFPGSRLHRTLRDKFNYVNLIFLLIGFRIPRKFPFRDTWYTYYIEFNTGISNGIIYYTSCLVNGGKYTPEKSRNYFNIACTLYKIQLLAFFLAFPFSSSHFSSEHQTSCIVSYVCVKIGTISISDRHCTWSRVNIADRQNRGRNGKATLARKDRPCDTNQRKKGQLAARTCAAFTANVLIFRSSAARTVQPIG